MKDPKILLITDDVIAASKIIRWLDQWEYHVKIMSFGNESISYNNLLKYDLILIDLPHKDDLIGLEAFDIIKNFTKVPIICTGSNWKTTQLNFLKPFTALKNLLIQQS